MDITALLVKIGAIGVILGAGITSLGFLYKSRLSNLATLKVCLYQLLELERSMLIAQALHDKSTLDLYWEIVEEEVPGEIPPHDLEQVKVISKSLLDATFGAAASEDHNDLQVGFKKAIEKLAPISPVLAARINSNMKVKSVLPAIDMYYEKLNEHPQVKLSEVDSRALQEVNATYKYKLISQALASLRSDILHVAVRSGILDWFRIYMASPTKAMEEYEQFRKDEMRALVREMKVIFEKYAKET